MLSYWAYILIGDNDTGKTGFQKYLVSELCGRRYKRLRRNLVRGHHPSSDASWHRNTFDDEPQLSGNPEIW